MSKVKNNNNQEICMECGTWIEESIEKNNMVCKSCKKRINIFPEFTNQCNEIIYLLQEDEERWNKIKDCYNEPLSLRGPLYIFSIILPIISAFIIGILANATYDLIKNWILSKTQEFKNKISTKYDYEKLVDIIYNFIYENIDEINKIKFHNKKDSKIFHRKMKVIKKIIEEQKYLKKNQNKKGT